jgi:adenylate cyclase
VTAAAEVIDWILRSAPAEDVSVLITGLVERLAAAGVPLMRLATNTMILHPELDAENFTWTEGQGIARRPITHAYLSEVTTPRTNAVRDLRDGLFDELRVRPGVDETPYAPIRSLAESGTTDYLLCALTYSDRRRRAYVSFATGAKGGFTEAQLATLRALVPAFGLRMELVAATHATRGLLDVYLGHNAAKRVLAGAFKRGTGEVVRAAIWYCDLRGFTSFVDAAPVHEVVPTLDRYFDAVAQPVTGAGGEILKFIGDAMLAIFPIGEDPREACRAALSSAERALEAIRPLSPLRIGVALHVGDVMYGNIGASGRLDFTVIGAAVNEVCRLESLCKEAGVPLLVTGEFLRAHGGAELVSLGQRTLRGVAESAEIATLCGMLPR